MQNPPLEVPSHIAFGNVPRAVPATADGGGQTKFAGNVVARIDGDDAGVFTVAGMETLALVRDPDTPGRSWQTVETVDGSGPIPASQALIVTVHCSLPETFAQTTLGAVVAVVAEGTDSPVLMQLGISGTVNVTGNISIDTVPGPALENGFLPGDTANLQFLLGSTMADPITGTLSCPSAAGSPFSSPGVTATVPARGQIIVTIPVTCARAEGAPLVGPRSFDQVEFDFTSDNSAGNSRILMMLTVLSGRAVSAASSLGPDLSLVPGIATLFQIIGTESGGTNPFTMTPGPAPDGVDLRTGALTTDIGGTEGDDLITTYNMMVSVKNGTSVGPLAAPVTVNWFVAADDTHPAVWERWLWIPRCFPRRRSRSAAGSHSIRHRAWRDGLAHDPW